MKPTKLGWQNCTLDDIAEKVDYGHTASAADKPVGPRFLRITDIQNGGVHWESVPYCECSAQDIHDSGLAAGDIVFARTGATTGKSFLIDAIPEPSVFASYLIRLRLKSGYEPRLLAYYFRTENYWGTDQTAFPRGDSSRSQRYKTAISEGGSSKGRSRRV